jgi:hypothetical protein
VGYPRSQQGVDGDEYRWTQPAATRGRWKPGGMPVGKITPEPPEERRGAPLTRGHRPSRTGRGDNEVGRAPTPVVGPAHVQGGWYRGARASSLRRVQSS